METQELDFEKYPPGMPKDETDVNLRAYFTRMDDAKLAKYDPKMSDEQLIEWDGNFRSDGALMLTCSERDVKIDEYREVIEQYVEFKKQNS